MTDPPVLATDCPILRSGTVAAIDKHLFCHDRNLANWRMAKMRDKCVESRWMCWPLIYEHWLHLDPSLDSENSQKMIGESAFTDSRHRWLHMSETLLDTRNNVLLSIIICVIFGELLSPTRGRIDWISSMDLEFDTELRHRPV
jgi:hypothetical protein